MFRARNLRAWIDDEDGSQVVSHVLVQVLVVFMVLGLMQLAFALHVRNVSIDAASEGARRAALVGATLSEGQARTDALLAGSLGAKVPRQIRLYEEVRAGEPVIVAEVATRLPVLGPFGPAQALTVSASAWKEPQ